jgi:Zn-dependent protease/CBS domain-containing protein
MSGLPARVMTSSFRFARVAGIDIRAHWSWVLIAALIMWSLSQGVFPQTNPGLSHGTYLAMAAVASVLLFASILLHELGHAIQARRDGVEIAGITLWVFGGVAEMKGALPSAGAEFRIAVAGPVVSLVLGVVFTVTAFALPLPAEVDGVAFWLGYVNLSLLVFNLIPALPLDGGRMLRAALWARRRDFLSATRTAAALGRGFGQLFIAGGLALTIFAGDYGGLWLVFTGWFVLAAAEAELQSAVARSALDGFTAAQFMVSDPVTVDAGTSVQTFMDRVFYPTRHTAYPVMDGGEPIGLVSFRQALALPPQEWPVTSVDTIAATGPETAVDASTPLPEVLPQLTEGDVRRLLVMRDGRLAGLLSATDVLRVLDVRSRVLGSGTRRFERSAPQRAGARDPA